MIFGSLHLWMLWLDFGFDKTIWVIIPINHWRVVENFRLKSCLDPVYSESSKDEDSWL